MAAAVDVPLVNITINDIPVQVPKGELIVEAVKRVGLEIPIFCYHPRMKPVGMCRMCLVEVGTKGPDGSVRMMPKPQAACSLPASEGLIIVTDTDKIHADRRGVLEFLLINHPLDCPICDRGGECPLQNNTLFYGPSTSRYIEVKRHAPKAFPLSQYVTLDLERCIQCGRCVRFTEEISGDAQLGFRFRGASMQPSTFEMRNFESKFSGNVIEICPVGALTSAKYRFRARPWDLQSRPGICTNCSNGCNVYVDYRVDQLVRINGRTNEAVNEEWTCDRGKFGHDWYNAESRLDKVLVRKNDRLMPAEWSEAYTQIRANFEGKGASVAALGGFRNSNEDLFMLSRLFRKGFGSANLDHRFETDLSSPVATGEKSPIVHFEDAKSILVFGTSLADEEPILFLRVRKAWFQNGTKVVVAHEKDTDVDSFAHLILRYRPGTAATLAAGLAGTASPEQVERETGVSTEDLREAMEILKGAPIIATRGLYDVPGGAQAASALTGISGSAFNLYARRANDEGAALLGIVPGSADVSSASGLNTHQILEGCANGSVKALWLVGIDLFEVADRDLATRALENVDFLVVQDTLETETTAYASVVLPMAGPAETDGSFTNLERRVQRFRPVLPVHGEAKPAWRTYEELMLRMSPSRPFFNAGEIMDAIAREVPAYEGCSYDGLLGEGFVLGQGADPSPNVVVSPVETNG